MAKVVDSHLCAWGSIRGKRVSFLIVSSNSTKLITVLMCSDQHVKYRMLRGFPLTSSLLLDYHVKTIDTHAVSRAVIALVNYHES